jgi:hypothetical protein
MHMINAPQHNSLSYFFFYSSSSWLVAFKEGYVVVLVVHVLFLIMDNVTDKLSEILSFCHAMVKNLSKTKTFW